MEKYHCDRQFSVRYTDVDFKDELKPSTALSYLQEAACFSADELGFGYEYLKPKDIAFMVTNVRLEFYNAITLGETVTVRTWPLIPTYAVFGREYQFYKQNGELAGNASSRWCAVHLPTGKIQASKFLDNQDYSTYNTDRALDVKNWKIPAFDCADGELRFSLTIANSEYDHYYHVNNTRYADYCFNVFTVEELKAWKLKSFAISYVRQCREGDYLRFFRKFDGGVYYVQGVNENGETVVQSEIVFQD